MVGQDLVLHCRREAAAGDARKRARSSAPGVPQCTGAASAGESGARGNTRRRGGLRGISSFGPPTIAAPEKPRPVRGGPPRRRLAYY